MLSQPMPTRKHPVTVGPASSNEDAPSAKRPCGDLRVAVAERAGLERAAEEAAAAAGLPLLRSDNNASGFKHVKVAHPDPNPSPNANPNPDARTRRSLSPNPILTLTPTRTLTHVKVDHHCKSRPFQLFAHGKSYGYFATGAEAALAYVTSIGKEEAEAEVAGRVHMTVEEALAAAAAEGLPLVRGITKTGFSHVVFDTNGKPQALCKGKSLGYARPRLPSAHF